ncbi:MAG: diguanylate cyclase [bacterium]|nr:diguanylate cyclase [bacterium]
MPNSEVKRYLKDFVSSPMWKRTIREILLHKLGSAYCWLGDEGGDFIYREEEDYPYCQMIKKTENGIKQCEETFISSLQRVKEEKKTVITPCPAGFLTFNSPIIVDKEVVGVIGCCQVIDAEQEREVYQKTARDMELNEEDFLKAIEGTQAASLTKLRKEAELISLLAQSYIDLIIAGENLTQNNVEVDTTKQFHDVFKLNRDLLIDLQPEQFYALVVDLASRAMNSRICSLMVDDEETGDITIKAAVGLQDEIVKGTRLKRGKGIVGHVIELGEPLLVEDIEKDSRFGIKKSAGKYYTKSLMISPLKMGDKVVGALNINNEASRRAFNENDLNSLTKVSRYIGSAIEGMMEYHQTRKEQAAKAVQKTRELEEAKASAQEAQERASVQAEELTRLKAETERLAAIAGEKEREAEEKAAQLTQLEKEMGKLKEQIQMDRAKMEQEAATLRAGYTEEIEELQEEIEELQKVREKAQEEREQMSREISEYQEKIQAEKQKVEEKIAEMEELERKRDTERTRLAEEKAKLGEKLDQERVKREEQEEEIAGLEEEAKRASRLFALEDEISETKKQYEEAPDEETKELYAERLTELNQKKEQLGQARAEASELRLLYETIKAIAPMKEPEGILETVTEKIKPYFDYHVGIYVMENEGRLIGKIKETCPIDVSCRKGIEERLNNAWQKFNPTEKRKISFSLEESEYEVLGSVTQEETKSFITAPIKEKGKLTGLLDIESLQENHYTALDRRLIAIIATQTGIATERARLFVETKKQAERDELTGVYNYRYFDRLFETEFERARKFNRALSLLMLDFDRLKEINDRYGHEEGNRLIKTVSNIIGQQIREVDFLARFGGDEFGVILPETAEEDAAQIAERIRAAIDKYSYTINEKTISLSASLGVSTFPAPSKKELFDRADKALYQAKQEGRNRVNIFREG